MKIIVETQEEFNTWIAGQRTFGDMMDSQQEEAPAQVEEDQNTEEVAQVQI